MHKAKREFEKKKRTVYTVHIHTHWPVSKSTATDLTITAFSLSSAFNTSRRANENIFAHFNDAICKSKIDQQRKRKENSRIVSIKITKEKQKRKTVPDTQLIKN